MVVVVKCGVGVGVGGVKGTATGVCLKADPGLLART